MDNQMMMVQQPEPMNAMALIDSMSSNMVVQAMGKIATFQKMVRKNLVEGEDYGVIPGTGQKPTLLKQGAEKINMMMGMSPQYSFLSKIEDFDSGFFSFDILCTLTHNGVVMAQGVGNCNSKEVKYRYNNVDRKKLEEMGIPEEQAVRFVDRYGKERYRIETPDPADKLNTILKMAKKRAYVDATLQVASLSNLFTQDLEDMDFSSSYQAPGQQPEESFTYNEAVNVPITFGKHKGKTLGQIYSEAPDYIDWLEKADKTDPMIRRAIGAMKAGMRGKAPAQDIEPPFMPSQDIGLPFMDEAEPRDEDFLNSLGIGNG